MPEHITFTLRFLLFAFLHSLFATERVKSRLSGSNTAYRICYNLASAVCFAWVMAADNNSRILYVAPGVWSLFMYLAQCLVAVILYGCLRQTGIPAFLGLRPLQHHKLSTTGWYGLVRHPLYLFSMVFLLLNPVMSIRWLLLTVFSLVYFIAGGMIEERRLLVEYGDEYRDYQAHVPFMLPDLLRFRQRPSV